MFRMAALAGVVALALAPNQGRRVDLEADCASVNMMFGDYEVAQTSQRTSIPVTVGALDIRPDFNGGVRIERGSGGQYGVTACIGAGARNRADAQAAVDSIRLDVQGNRVRV